MKKILFIIMINLLLISGCSNTKSIVKNNGTFQTIYNENKADNLVDLSNDVMVDFSHLNEGYCAIKIDNESTKYKVQFTFNGEKYYYDVKNNGELNYYTFSYGNGKYKISIMKNTSGNKYVSVGNKEVNVQLIDEFQPFIRPNYNVNYTKEFEVIKVANELVKDCDTDADYLEVVYKAVCDRLRYDNKKAETVQKGYVPNVDDVWNEKKGICYDYAVIAAVMLRSQGIPCKVIAGYVNGDYYHAWNVVYLQDEGWVVYTYSLESKAWSRVDLTFADQMVTKDYLTYSYVDCLYY